MPTLPVFLRNSTFIKLFFNASWLLSERFLTLILGFFVGIYVARYLGPSQYGLLSFVTSLVSLFAVATHMGLSGIVVRDLVKKPAECGEIMGSTIALKFLGGTIGFLLFCVYAFTTERTANIEFSIILIISATMFLKPFEVFDFWFESQVQGRFSALSKSTALILTSVFKILLVISGAGLFYFAFAYFLQILLMSFFSLYFYRKTTSLAWRNWKINAKRAKVFLQMGWMVMLGSFFATVYLRIDKVMLKTMVGDHAVGIYAVASQLSEVWYFIPTAIVASLFPKLISLRERSIEEFNKRLQQLFDFLFILALALAIPVAIFAEPLVLKLYGPAYQHSGTVLSIHIWAGLFIFMRAAFSKWILIENALQFSMITQGLGALLNVFLNLLLIPRYAEVGAALATLLSYAMASYISLAVYPKSRPVFWMMTRSLVSPIRIPFDLLARRFSR